MAIPFENYKIKAKFIMFIWLVLFLLHPGSSSKSFIFESSLHENINHIILKTSIILPKTFTACVSYKETRIDKEGSFTIYGESNTPWISLSTWDYANEIAMWLIIGSEWLKVRTIPSHWINFWTHVCINVDTQSGNISLSINGEQPLLFKSTEIEKEKPSNLKGKLYIGLCTDRLNGERQFFGEVSNINIFSTHQSNVSTMSSNLCTLVGDIVNSESMWDVQGQVLSRYQENWAVCDNNKTYTVAITARLNWNEANKACNKLGGGVLKEPKNSLEIESIVSNFNEMNSSCDWIWTPLFDEEVEGQFKSSITGKIATFLPWDLEQPNGYETENHIAINVKAKLYNDLTKFINICAACDVKRTTVFYLFGVCEHSYFGNFAFDLFERHVSFHP